MRSVKPVSWDRGTEITVRDLFFNVPARRKFLRSHDTELGHIARLVTHYALAHPEIRFTLKSDGREMIDAVAVKTVAERIYQIFGEGFLENLVELNGQAGLVKMHGYSSRPHEQRTTPYSQFFYVNRRMVRDKVVTSAIRQAYRNCIPASAYPVVILFLELPFDEVDVNAHPAKTEIRFRDQSAVHSLILNTIQRSGRNRFNPGIRASHMAPVMAPDAILVPGCRKQATTDSISLPAASPNRSSVPSHFFPGNSRRRVHGIRITRRCGSCRKCWDQQEGRSALRRCGEIPTASGKLHRRVRQSGTSHHRPARRPRTDTLRKTCVCNAEQRRRDSGTACSCLARASTAPGGASCTDDA